MSFAAFLPLIGSAANAGASIITNQQQIKANERMYERQRQDALADWARQNEYNSPQQQMQRYKEAGLNPNLIYGQMGQGATIRSSDYKAPNLQAPQIDPSTLDVVGQSLGYKQQQAQTDNARKQFEVAEAQEQLIKANTLKTLSDVDLKNFALEKGNKMLGYQLEAAAASIANTTAKTSKTLTDQQLSFVMSSNSIDETLARISKIKADISKVPLERSLMRAQEQNIRNSINWRNISASQKKVMNDVLMESSLWKNLLLEQNLEHGKIKMDLDDIKRKFKELGVSETVSSDILSDIMKILSRR